MINRMFSNISTDLVRLLIRVHLGKMLENEL